MQAFSLARMNIRHNSILHIALSAAVLLLTPVLFGIAELDALAAAVPLEMFVALIGIILLTPVFQPEHTPGTEELVAAKYVGCGIIYAIRVLYSLGILMLLILLFSVYMREAGCSISPALVCGTIADAVFLGGLGMAAAALVENTAAAYMIPVAYYAISFGGGRRMGDFYLFSMTLGDYTGKPWMFAAGILLIGLALWVKELKRRWR